MAYGKHGKPTVINIIASQLLYCPGKLDLLTEPSARQPINIERYFSKSFFSKKNSVKTELMVEQTGFLPGESLPFTLTLTNLTGDITIMGLTLSLQSKVVYAADSKTKTVTTTLTTKSFNDIESKVGETIWMDFLDIPHALHPSHGGIIGLYYLLMVKNELF